MPAGESACGERPGLNSKIFIISKIAESWFLHCLRPYLYASSNQFAFKCGSSVDDALATVQSAVVNGFESCHPAPTRVTLISLGISKTFDQASDELLINSIQKRNTPGSPLGVVRSYLSGRLQTVIVEGAKSQQSSSILESSLTGN